EEEAPPRRPSRSEAISERRSTSSAGVRDRPDRRRRDEDEEEDDRRPRGRRRDEDEEEDDDRPRRRRNRYEEDEDDYEDDYDDRPRGAARAWAGVRLGVNLVLLGGWAALGNGALAILGFGVMLLFGVSLLSMARGRGGRGAPGAAAGAATLGVGAMAFQWVIKAIGVAITAMQLTGCALCMQVPSGRGGSSRGLAIAAFACLAAATVPLALF